MEDTCYEIRPCGQQSSPVDMAVLASTYALNVKPKTQTLNSNSYTGQQSLPVDMGLFDALAAYIAAFFHGIQVQLRPAVTVHIEKTSGSQGRGRLLGNTVRWRNR